MVKTYDLRLTSERTIRVMVGRMREYISMEHKTKAQIFEAVKWALISKDAFIDDITLTEDLHREVWQYYDPDDEED